MVAKNTNGSYARSVIASFAMIKNMPEEIVVRAHSAILTGVVPVAQSKIEDGKKRLVYEQNQYSMAFALPPERWTIDYDHDQNTIPEMPGTEASIGMYTQSMESWSLLQEAIDDLRGSGWLRAGDQFSARVIGRGGCSIIYRITQNVHGALDDCVVKIPLRPDDAECFEAERAMMSRVPCAARCLPTKDHAPYIAMEFFDGKSLDQIHHGADTKLQTLLCEKFAGVMRTVFDAHVVHSDIKPANVLLRPDGALKILDFGLAMEAPPPQTRVQTGRLRGTPLYMAPEQWDEEVHERTDVFAAGCLLYRMLTGRDIAQEMTGGICTVDAVAQAMHSNSTTSAIHDIIAATHIPMRHLLERMLKVDPDRRPDWGDIVHCIQTMYRKILRKTPSLVCMLGEQETAIDSQPTVLRPPREEPPPTRLDNIAAQPENN